MAGHTTIRERLEDDNAVVGAVARVPTPTLVEVYGDVGLDFCFLDYEHASGRGRATAPRWKTSSGPPK